jgi:hypothetical protein
VRPHAIRANRHATTASAETNPDATAKSGATSAYTAQSEPNTHANASFAQPYADTSCSRSDAKPNPTRSGTRTSANTVAGTNT